MIQSKYDGKCKDCSTPHKEGDTIDRNQNGNWCKLGNDCPAVRNPNQTTIPQQTVDERIERAKKAMEEFIDTCLEKGVPKAADLASTVWNTEAMRK